MRLSKNWLTEGHIDLEYKQYIVLAFLKHINTKFNQECLYPALGELVFHHRNLLEFWSKKNASDDQLKKELSSIDFKKMKLRYQNPTLDNQFIEEINEIIRFAIPKFEYSIIKGKELYDDVESRMTIHPLGIQPNNVGNGMVFMKRKNSGKIRIYQYAIKNFYRLGEKYKGLNFEFLKEKKQSLGETLEQIKLQIIRKQKLTSLPATYLIEHGFSGSYYNTTYPIAQRMLIKYVNTKV